MNIPLKSIPGKKRCSRIMVSVPHEVRLLMKKYPQVNWSAVAAEAFRQVIGQLSR